jgi:dipeptidyl-peptidase-4
MKKTNLYALLLCVWLLTNLAYAQKKQITLEDVWARGTFRTKSVYGVNWTKDGQYYTSQVENKIVKYEITTGKEVATLYDGSQEFDGYAFSVNEDKILLESTQEQIYRRSTRSNFYVYEIAAKKLRQINEGIGTISYCTFSPDGSKVAYVRGNNLYFKDLATLTEVEITNTGKFNHIINGSTDWVYEEEFGFAQAFFWSPDSKKIAFYIFDESKVKEYNMQMWQGQKAGYPNDYRFKYPKVGEDNSLVEIAIYHLDNKKVVKADIGTEKDQYIPRIKWTNDANTLSIRRLNRWQNNLDVLHADAQTGATKVILNEKSETYVDVEYTDHLTYLADGKHFIFASERTGFKHLYLYDMAGKLVRPITTGEWEVTDFHGIDEKKKLVYFSSAEVSPLERHVYVIGFDGKGKKQLSTEKGSNEPNFSADFKYYLNYHETASTPLTVTLHESPSGKKLKTLEDNAKAREVWGSYQISAPEFFSFKTEDATSLNGYMIKPQNFDASKKYPVLMFVYGGPGSQTVKDENLQNYFWHQMLAQKGYIIVSIDNRGTGARGTKFKHSTYLQLGKYEIQDQISGAKYLGTLPFVDNARIGIWGWSYGGYMASLGITVGAEVFKTAIAVAPVTTWRFYDSIYTERYLRRPQDNASGYDDNSPINHVNKMKGNYFLIHGTGDDNVHFQNAVEMQDALIKANKQFTSFYYPNRNHGIYGGVTRLHLFKMMTDYLEKNL